MLLTPTSIDEKWMDGSVPEHCKTNSFPKSLHDFTILCHFLPLNPGISPFSLCYSVDANQATLYFICYHCILLCTLLTHPFLSCMSSLFLPVPCSILTSFCLLSIELHFPFDFAHFGVRFEKTELIFMYAGWHKHRYMRIWRNLNIWRKSIFVYCQYIQQVWLLCFNSGLSSVVPFF